MLNTLLLLVLYVLSLVMFCILSSRLPVLSKEALHRVSSLDGLRGILATSTVVTHFAVSYQWHTTGVWAPTSSRILNNMGVVPVSLFFMITGYLFIGKIYRGSPDWGVMLSSRLRRIFPMYLFTVLLIVAISFYQTPGLLAPVDETLSHIGNWMIFIGKPINGFADSARINASVHWTLLYEAVFYLCLPLIYCVLRRRRPGLACAVVLVVLACLWPEYHHYLRSKYLKLFMVGALVALFEDRLKATAVNFAGTGCTALALAVLAASLYLKSYSSVQMIILGIPFGLFVLGNSLNGLLEHRGLKILGEASFSLYLLHGIVIYTLFSVLGIYDFSTASFTLYALYLPVIVLVASSLSVLTYWCIERPFLRKRLPSV
jgi:peptidoglycan/LPS O-acetylase OafA/YrhL